MKVERLPRDRAEENLKKTELQKTVWLDLNRRFTSLREISRQLYSYQNPFSERIAESADESVLGATASREAIEESRSFQIKQLASADRFLSAQLPQDYRVPAGEYVFTVGEKTVKLNYSGGSLKDFTDALNRKGSTIIRAQLVNATKDTRYLLIESLLQGSENRLILGEAAQTLGLDTGMLEKADSARQQLSLERAERFEKNLEPEKVKFEGGRLGVHAESETAIRFPTPIAARGLVLEIEYETVALSEEEAMSIPTGPTIPETGSVSFEDISIQSAFSDPSLPEWKAPIPKQRVDDSRSFFLLDQNGRSIALSPMDTGAGIKKLTVPLEVYTDTLGGVGIRNSNTHRDIFIHSVKVFDPSEIGEYRAQNPVASARDAIIVMDGIEVIRSSNTVDDLVPGVSLTLRGVSEKSVKLDIKPNVEAAKNGIIELVGTYNRLMAEMNILSRNEESILAELDYLSREEKEEYRERLGLFQGETLLSLMRSSLQGIMMDAHETEEGTELLSSFGISTNTGRAGGGYDASRLRGYLEIDEGSLDKALETRFQVVRQVFGWDSDFDLIIDSGVAFKLDSLLRPYVETGGIVSSRTRTLDLQIDSQKRNIDNLDKQLAKKEAELKRKYGLMEGALDQMESSSKAWENFGKSSN